MSQDVILVKRDDLIVTWTINRPEAMNAINREVAQSLLRLASELEGDREARVLIITGAGDKSFSAGADLKMRHSLTPEENREYTRTLSQALKAIESLPQPVIAAINGYCLGGGLELALVCDFRFAAEHAVLGLPEIRLGTYPGGGGAVRLPRLISMSKAKELVFTGKRVKAQEAERIGLVDKVVPLQELMGEARLLAEELMGSAPLGLRAVKRVMNLSLDLDLAVALELSNAVREPLEGTKDRREALAAFVEKRQPRFIGE